VKKARNLATGFTLFEVLIAVSIFALISTIAMTNLIQVGRAGERISNAQQRLSDIQFAMAYMAKDMTQLINRKVRDKYGDEQEQFMLSENVLQFTHGGWSNFLQQTRSQLQRVEYRLEDEILFREYWLQLDQGYNDQPVKQSLLDGVEKFEVRLITTGNDKLDAWPATSSTGQTSSSPPVAVEISIEMKDFGLVRRIYEVSNVF
jgi:general secretion pathway protein J